jgi:hypothetical protein
MRTRSAGEAVAIAPSVLKLLSPPKFSSPNARLPFTPRQAKNGWSDARNFGPWVWYNTKIYKNFAFLWPSN